MDAVIQAAPQLGAMFGLVYLVVLLLRREATSNARHTAELQRLSDARDREVTTMREQVDWLTAELRKLRGDQ